MEVNSENEGVTPQEQAPNLEEMQKRMQELESTNARLLDESYKAKQKYKQASEKVAELDEVKKAHMTAEERQREIEMELAEKQKALEDKERKILESNTKALMASRARDAIDVSDIYSLHGQFGDCLELNADGDACTPESVDKFISIVKEKKPYLFRQSETKTDTTPPEFGAPKQSVSEKMKSANGDLSKLSMDDLWQAIKL